MEIIEVKQNYPEEYFIIEVSIGDICNFQCQYCYPGSNSAIYKWPNYELLVKNLSHLVDYYIKNTNKRKFEFNILGGESTHWKYFIPFIKYFKDRYDCIFSLTTNGSKNLNWWKEAVLYLDQISISHHQQFTNIVHTRDLADLIYESNVFVNIMIMMDANDWDNCLKSIEYYKKSKRRWSIICKEIIDKNITYTDKQRKLIKDYRIRSSNPFWFFKVNKQYRSKVTVIDEKNKSYKIQDNTLIFERLNKFLGWECSLGVNWISIKHNGNISGICNNSLYNIEEILNIYDINFIEKFQPKIISTVCKKDSCWCAFEANMNKKKVII
jgi:MoaA/NifB/PqqE/SkfB family radical SAM enzyme